MRNLRPAILLLGLSLPLAACASGGAGPSTRGGSASELMAEQLVATGHSNLFEAIRQLRPMWLRTRGTGSGSGDSDIPVYVDGVRRGGIEFLQTIQVTSVREVHRISANDATTRWGTGHRNGAIEVVRR